MNEARTAMARTTHRAKVHPIEWERGGKWKLLTPLCCASDTPATSAEPASTIRPAMDGPHIAHQSAELSANLRRGGSAAQTTKTAAPIMRNRNRIIGTSIASI